MNDRLRKFLFDTARVRGALVRLDASWREVRDRHAFPPAVEALAGEAMAAMALLASTLKFDGSIVMQAQGSGPVTLLVVECRGDRTLRATAQWSGDVPLAPLAAQLGNARLAITFVPAIGGQSYQGVVEVRGEGIGAALEHYMLRSEQLPTRLWLAAGADCARGLLLQRLPAGGADAGAESAADIEDWSRLTLLAGTVTADELRALDDAALLRRLFAREDLRLHEPQAVAFRCSCSGERVTAMLRMLGREEVAAILAERPLVEVACEFCGRRYRFDDADVERLFAAGAEERPGRRDLH